MRVRAMSSHQHARNGVEVHDCISHQAEMQSVQKVGRLVTSNHF